MYFLRTEDGNVVSEHQTEEGARIARDALGDAAELATISTGYVMPNGIAAAASLINGPGWWIGNSHVTGAHLS